MGIRPTLQLQFARTERLDPRITFTRASAANVTDRFGNNVSVGNNIARFFYSGLNPIGLAIEEQRTNSLRNNTMQGAAAGNPGTLPTNWVNSDNSGIRQIVDLNVVQGINTIALNYNGTATAANEAGIQMEAATQVAASSGQVWTYSTWLQEVLQDVDVTGLHIDVIALDSSAVEINRTTVTVGAGTKTQLQRYQCTHTMPASTAYVLGRVRYSYSGTPSLNYTLRIGMPQLEQGAEATSVIPTAGTSVSRAADNATMTGVNFTSWFNPTEGTFVVKSRTGGLTTNKGIFGVGDATLAFGSGEMMYSSFAIGLSGNIGFTVYDGGVNQAALTPSGTPAANTLYTSVASYKANNCAASYDNKALVTDTSGTLPTVTAMSIGSLISVWSGGANYLNGTIDSITYYPARLTNAQLTELMK